MRNELISFETALLAKEKGFKEKTWYKFIYVDSIKEIGKINRDQSKGDSPENWNNWFNNEKIKFVSIPYQCVLQKWLREKYKINILVKFYESGTYTFAVYTHNGDATGWSKITPFMNTTSEKYEEALEEGLIQGLKLIK